MPDEKQAPLEHNSSADLPEPDKATEAAHAEQKSKQNGSAEPDKAPENTEPNARGDGSPEAAKAPGSANTEHVPEDDRLKHSSKYLFDLRQTSGTITLVVGDKQSVTLEDYKGVVRGKGIKRSGENGDCSSSDTVSGNTSEQISKTLQFERQSTTFLAEHEAEAVKLPETEEEFSEWYYGLGEYEQYYVQTAAILHGAPVHEVSKRTDSFYKRIREEVESRETAARSGFQQANQQETQQKDASRFTDPLLRRTPSRDLRHLTHTITRREKGMERLYWRDVDQYGLSQFGVNLLAFLTQEFINRGEHGQISLEVLEEWSKENRGEIPWKAAHSYGVVLWCHDTEQLGKIAEQWAKMNTLPSRRRTAELLDGAFEIERIKGDGEAQGERTSSVVLSLLNTWIDRVHADLSKVNASLGCTVASIYGLIGRKSRKIALDGLEHLLKLPQSRITEETSSIFAAGVSTYVTLTWSGHVRYVLDRLAVSVEQLSHCWDLPHDVDKRQPYRRQREVRLNATFDAFFLIAAASLTEQSDYPLYSLAEPFPSQPTLPDPGGRDVLLQGLLSASDVRENMTTLLCAAIVEKKSRPVFEFLRYWAVVMLKRRAVWEGDEVYLSFRQFMVCLGKTVYQWCLDLEKQNLRSPQSLEVFKNRLEQWQIDARYHSNPTQEQTATVADIGSLAQEVLQQLDDPSLF